MKLKLERMSHATLSLLEFHYYFRDNGAIYFQGWNTKEDGDWLLRGTKSICGLAREYG